MAQDCLKGSIKCPFKCGNSNTVTVCLFHELSGISLNQTHQKENPPGILSYNKPVQQVQWKPPYIKKDSFPWADNTHTCLTGS